MTGPRKKSILTPYGRGKLDALKRKLPWVGIPLTALLMLLLGGCVTSGDVDCHLLPDGNFTCSGEVNGM